ncbi:MAG: hypothetical protein KL863_08960 [Rhizobium sp.]|nr:hypothetical protein [Rhizobium sp.]
MAHVRTQIREWLKINLAGSADAGPRVFARRTLPLAKELAPTLIFSIQNEMSVDISMSGTQERTEMLRVTACAKGDADETEDQLDRMALFVERVLSGNPCMAGLIQTYAYQSTEFSFSGEGEKTFCTAALTFALTLFTQRTHAETAL